MSNTLYTVSPPKKPTKWGGVKVFVNSESTTGYELTFDVYTGSGSGSTHDHKLFTDNFYTSPFFIMHCYKEKQIMLVVL